MSYDLYLRLPRCAVCGRPHEYNYESMSPTYNVGRIFRAALGEGGIHALHGLRGKDLARRAELGLAWMRDERNRENWRKLEPENGWGSGDTVLDTLSTIVRWATECPTGIFDSRYGEGIEAPPDWAEYRCADHQDTPTPEPGLTVDLARAVVYCWRDIYGACAHCDSYRTTAGDHADREGHDDECIVLRALDVLEGARRVAPPARVLSCAHG